MQPDQLSDPHDGQPEHGQQHDQDRSRHRCQLLVAVDSTTEHALQATISAAGGVDAGRSLDGVLEHEFSLGRRSQGALSD